MDWDEPQGAKKTKARDLSVLGVTELKDYIAELQAEIIRAQAEIAKRGDQKNAAEALFRT